ncbi:MAG: hypothetical protein ACTSSQ_03015 [Alphaproteobacteria bacterium]
MEQYMDEAARSGNLVWMFPAVIGGAIVAIGLLYLLFSRRNPWAIVLLIVFGGMLTSLNLVKKFKFGADGISLETVAAVRDTSDELKIAISANTDAIEGIKNAVSEIQTLSTRVATSITAGGAITGSGNVGISDLAISRINQDISSSLSNAATSIEASKAAELRALQNIEKLDRLLGTGR